MNNRLGKGIEALIKTRNLNQDEYLDGFVDIDKIKINPDQPRKYFNKESLDELVESIKEKGILQPIAIKALDDGTFELIAGERRFRAAKILKIKTIPAYIIKVESDAEKLELALIENIQRSDLNVIEEAEAYYILKEKYNLTHKQIAKRVGKGRVEITRTIELIRLPDNIKQLMIENFNNSDFAFSRGHARSVRKTEEIVKKNNKNHNFNQKSKVIDELILNDESLLSSTLGAKVEILNKKNHSGHIKINFKSKEDRERIIRIIQSSEEMK